MTYPLIQKNITSHVHTTNMEQDSSASPCRNQQQYLETPISGSQFEKKSQSSSFDASRAIPNKLDSIKILVNQHKGSLMLNKFNQDNKMLRNKRGLKQFSSYADSVNSFQSNTKGNHSHSQSLSVTNQQNEQNMEENLNFYQDQEACLSQKEMVGIDQQAAQLEVIDEMQVLGQTTSSQTVVAMAMQTEDATTDPNYRQTQGGNESDGQSSKQQTQKKTNRRIDSFASQVHQMVSQQQNRAQADVQTTEMRIESQFSETSAERFMAGQQSHDIANEAEYTKMLNL